MAPRGIKPILAKLGKQIRACEQCPLHQSRTLAVPGEGPAPARGMIIGEAPGKDEDKTGVPFVGSAGKYLDHVLEGSRISRADFFITNIVKCRPEANRKPKAKEVETCTMLYLFKQIELVNPAVVLLLGGVAVQAVLGVKTVEEARAKSLDKDGRLYLATYHPAVRFYREDLAIKIKEDFIKLREAMLKS